MVLRYDFSSWYKWQRRTNVAFSMAMAVCRCNTERITRCSMTRASPKATGHHHPVTTCSVLPRRLPWRQSTQLKCNMYPICWPFWWPYYAARVAQWRRFVAFIKATKNHHRASTRSNRHQPDMPAPISGVYFIVKSLKKSSSCPNINRGVTHQTDEKYHSMSEYFVGVVNIAFDCYNNCFVLCIINHYLLKYL